MKCPVCEKQIDSLKCIVHGTTEYRLSCDIQGDMGDIQYENCGFVADTDRDEYTCPKCNVFLFEGEPKAVAFLKGE